LAGGSAYPEWKQTVLPAAGQPVVKHGAFYAAAAMHARVDPDTSPAAHAAATALHQNAGGPAPAALVQDREWLRARSYLPSPQDVEQLMRDPSLMLTAKSLQERAAALGLAVPAETAATMLERWLFSEKAYRVLKANGYHDTLKRLRAAADPMPAAELAPKLKPMDLSDGTVPSSLPRAQAQHAPPHVAQQQPATTAAVVGVGRGAGTGVSKKKREYTAEQKELWAKNRSVKAKAHNHNQGRQLYANSKHHGATDAANAAAAAGALAALAQQQ
jgi:hypothetical protein